MSLAVLCCCCYLFLALICILPISFLNFIRTLTFFFNVLLLSYDNFCFYHMQTGCSISSEFRVRGETRRESIFCLFPEKAMQIPVMANTSHSQVPPRAQTCALEEKAFTTLMLFQRRFKVTVTGERIDEDRPLLLDLLYHRCFLII